MRAVVVTRPGGLDALQIKDVPVPVPRPGWVRIQVKAFGVNEAEVTTRKGESDAEVTYPRIPGIEGVGLVAEADEDSGLRQGQQVGAARGAGPHCARGGIALRHTAEHRCSRRAGLDQVSWVSGSLVMPGMGSARRSGLRIARVVLAVLSAPRVSSTPTARLHRVAMARGAVAAWTVEASSAKGRP
ncbi:alcohol dehydrogenase catalytic domain-containing protein [Streptomyces asoensis]|nr:alcohol dehydrogenase catalytic domain-containing protein [Streptomyces sp. MBT97]